MRFPVGSPPIQTPWGGQPPVNGPLAISPSGGPVQPIWGGQPPQQQNPQNFMRRPMMGVY